MSAQSLERYTFAYLINEALSYVPDTVDKRQGSIIYDALAPACYVLADYYMQLRNVYIDTFIDTAFGDALELRVAERGMFRQQATHAVKKATFQDSDNNPVAVSVGTRFSTVSDTSPLVYVVTDDYTVAGTPVAGSYLLTCETAGTVGNGYTGPLIGISFVRGLSTATMSTLIVSASDEETDDELKARYLSSMTDVPFGGNVAQYKELLKSIPGIGDVQVYPVWDGGGTVKCSVVSPTFTPVSSELLTSVQEQVDPSVAGTGRGLAPIGHSVTISNATSVVVNVAATVTLVSGFTIPHVQDAVEASIAAYITELCESWGVSNASHEYALSVYLSRMIACILQVPGITNVSAVTINSTAADLVLTENSTTQQIPILGEVTLS